MKKMSSVTLYAVLFFVGSLAQALHGQTTLNVGAIDSQGSFGTGNSKSYFVVDFGGSPASAVGPRDSYAFEFRWDAPNTTPAVGLFSIANDSLLDIQTTDFGGGLGLRLDTLAFGDDTDTPDFDIDSRFWNLFVGTLNSGSVDWVSANFGISGGELDENGVLPGALVDGGFVGLRAQAFGAPDRPAIPVTAIPEPSGMVLLGFVAAIGVARRRRRV